MRRALLILTTLASAAALRADVPVYRMAEAIDVTEEDWFRALFVVEVSGTSAEHALAVAEDVVRHRTSRRLLHVAEVLIYDGAPDPTRPPEQLVVWAPGGDPTRRPPGKLDDYSSHRYVVNEGEAARRLWEPLREALASFRDDQEAALRIGGAGDGEVSEESLDEEEEEGAAPAAPQARGETPRLPSPGAPVPTMTPAVVRLHETPRAAPGAPGAASVPERTEAAQRDRSEVLTLLREWRTAWTSRNLDAYLRFYAPEFRSGDMDREAWRRHKEGVFARSGDIDVRMEDVQVEVAGALVRVSFLQDYRSARHRDRGRKRLELTKRDGHYLIVTEEWEPE